MVWEVEVDFHNVIFGVIPTILKQQLDDQLEKIIRFTSHEGLMG